MTVKGNAPRRGNQGQLGGKASFMAVRLAVPEDKEVKRLIRKAGVRDKVKLQQSLLLAEQLKQEHPDWEAERIVQELVESSAINTDVN